MACEGPEPALAQILSWRSRRERSSSIPRSTSAAVRRLCRGAIGQKRQCVEQARTAGRLIGKPLVWQACRMIMGRSRAGREGCKRQGSRSPVFDFPSLNLSPGWPMSQVGSTIGMRVQRRLNTNDLRRGSLWVGFARPYGSRSARKGPAPDLWFSILDGPGLGHGLVDIGGSPEIFSSNQTGTRSGAEVNARFRVLGWI